MDILDIDKRVSIVSPYPCVYIKDEDLLVISDTHLGLEEHRERLGISIPIVLEDDIIRYVTEPLKELGCKKVVLLGDVKHEFGKPSNDEWFYVKKMIKSIRNLGAEPEVVRGNHDNYIINILKGMNVKLDDPYLAIGKYFFMHGHLDLEYMFGDCEYILMGHEHPAITIKDDLNTKYRFKAFIVGNVSNKKVIVLPSASPLAYGNSVNELSKEELMCIILRKYGVDDFIPYIIEIEEFVKPFPPIKYLRSYL